MPFNDNMMSPRMRKKTMTVQSALQINIDIFPQTKTFKVTHFEMNIFHEN